MTEGSGSKLTLEELSQFTLQLSTMLKSGIGISAAMETISRSGIPRLEIVGNYLASYLNSGYTLSAAFSKLPRAFSPIYVRLVHSAEQSGTLTEVFDAISRNLDRARQIRAKVGQALLYPGFLLVACLLMAALLLFYMLPRFLEIFVDFGAPLPWPTRLLVTLCFSPLTRIGLPLGVTLVALSALYLQHTGRLTILLTQLRFRTPLIGTVSLEMAAAELCRTFALLLYNGLSLVPSLKLLAGTTGYPPLDNSLRTIAKRISQGDDLSETLFDQSQLPKLLRSALEIGEETGELARILDRVGEVLDESAGIKLANLVALLEPAVMAGMGLLVGFVVIATFLPVFQLLQVNL